jgi:hypothetical protein
MLQRIYFILFWLCSGSVLIPPYPIFEASVSKNITTPSPTFVSFENGDHYHFIFNVSHTKNTNRTFNNILRFITTSYAGTAEANTTIQQIRCLQRFLAYLLRKDIQTFNKYGTQTLLILKQLLQFLSNADETDTSTFEPCSTYINCHRHQQCIKEKHFLQLRAKDFDVTAASEENTLWLEELFSVNNIDIPNLFAHFVVSVI